MKFKKYIEENNISIEDAASALEFSYENVRRYAAGLVIPRAKNMKKIIDWSGGMVTPNDFFIPESKKDD